MDAYRIIEKPENHKITITLPESFGDEEVEVIVLPVEGKSEKKKEFDPTKYRGFLKDIEMDVDEECRKMRGEWDRGF